MSDDVKQELEAWGNALLARMDERFAEQDKRIDQRFAEQDKRFDQRFAEQDRRIEQRFAEQDKRFAEQDKRFAEQDKRFAEQDKRWDQRFAEQDQRWDQRFETWTGRIGEMLAAMQQALMQELRRHTVASTEELTTRVAVVDEQYRDLPARVSRLEAKVFKPRRAPKRSRG